MKLCILVLACVAVAWAYPTGEKSEALPAVPLVITDYSSVVKDTGVHPQKDAPQESAESNESSESEESSENKPAPPLKAAAEKPISIDSKSSEEQLHPTEPAKSIPEVRKEENKEDEKPAEPIKIEEPIKEEVKLEEPKLEMKTLAHDEEEIPAPVALPTETKADLLPENILEAASQPASIAEDTIPLTSAKREEPAEETEIAHPVIPALKTEEVHSHTEPIHEKTAETVVGSAGGTEYLRSPAAAPEPETKVEPIVHHTPEHPVIKSAEIHAEKVEEKIEAKSALPEPVAAIEEKHTIVTEEKKEEPKIKTEPIVETPQEGRTVRDAVKEEPIKVEETKPIEVEKKDEKIDLPAIKKIETVEEVKPIVETKPIVEAVKPIVEEEKPLAKAVPHPHAHPKVAEAKQVSSEESVEESVETKKEEKPLAAEEVPKPLALPSSEGTPLLKKVETTEEKKEEEVKVPAAVAAIATAELPKAVS